MRERIVSFFHAAFTAMHELGKEVCARDDETSNEWMIRRHPRERNFTASEVFL